MSQISDGAVVALQCQGTIAGDRFLDGLTAEGGVKLSPVTDGVFTGTHWLCSENADGTFTMACCGAIPGGRYLDGRTTDGTVGLAASTLPPFSGTRWQILDIGGDVVTIKCLGDIEGNRFLDGRTGEGTVGLAPSTDPPFSGTKWKTFLIAQPGYSVRTEPDQLGANLHIEGSGFTSNDSVGFSAEGIFGRDVPLDLGFAVADSSGAFRTDIEIRFAPVQPNNPNVVVRGTDHHGISGAGFTGGFSA
jgi:hypothetical protein